MTVTNLLLAVCPMLACQDPGTSAAVQKHPLGRDRTGLAWVLPFEKARAKAAAENRLLMIKPVAFGTTPDGGW